MRLSRDDGLVSLDMGVPNFDPASLPFEATREADIYPLRVGERSCASAPCRWAIRTR